MSATVLVKVIGVLYRIPLTAILGVTGMSYFHVAFSLFGTVHALFGAGIPAAVSRLVADSLARGRLRDPERIRRIAAVFCLVCGAVGGVVLYLGARPYTQLTQAPGAILAIRAMAPAMLFVCLSGCLRGYCEGFRDMRPTAISEVVEAVFRLIVGLGLARWMKAKCMAEFAQKGTVFGQPVESAERAALQAAPYAAAAAITGVVVSIAAGLAFLCLRHAVVAGGGRSVMARQPAPPARPVRVLARRILAMAFPVCLAALAMNLTALIDTASITGRLAVALQRGAQQIFTQYQGAIPQALTLEELPSYLFGAYSLALSVYHLVPAFTATFGVSALPSVTAAWATRDRRALERRISSVLRVTMLIAAPAGLGIAALPQAILTMLYPAQAQSIQIAAPILRVLGSAVVVMAAAAPVGSMLQAVGRADLPVKCILTGGAIKLLVNYLFIADPRFNIQAVGYGTLLCYLVIAVWETAALCRYTSIRLDLVSVFLKPLAAAAVCAITAFLLHSRLVISGNDILALILSVGAGAVVYGVMLVVLGAIEKQDVSMLPKGEKIAKRLEKYGVIR